MFKKAWTASLLSLILSASSNASDFSEDLHNEHVTHLDLLANNLTMFSLQKIDELKKLTSHDGIDLTAVKFGVSKDEKLIFNSYYTAPVQKVTKEQCEKEAKTVAEDFRKTDTAIADFIPVFVVLPTTREQAKTLTQETYITIYLQAKENPQLSVSCGV